MSDLDPQRSGRDLLAAYRAHTGPPPGAEARLFAALGRDILAPPQSQPTGPKGHVPADILPVAARSWRVTVGLAAAAAVIAAVAVRAGVGARQAGDVDHAAPYHAAPDTADTATHKPEVVPTIPPRIPDALPSPPVPELAPPPAPPPREPTTRPRREPANEPPSQPAAPTRTLADEMRRMRPAQRALAAGEPVTALTLLEDYAREFPDGHLREEYLAMHAIARCNAGIAGGPAEATAFLRAHPRSIFAERVRSACTEN